jgi:O-antigen/teichoic acid export membrane protein
LAGLAIINNLLLIPLYGITGAAMATAISIFLYNAILVWFVWWKIKIQPFSKNTIKGVLIIGLTFLINFAIYKFSNPLLDGFVRSLIITTIFGFAVFLTRVSPDLNSTLIALAKRFKVILVRKK